ncbi:DUF2510 domain-containing protein [Microbacterium dextranolyticum]|uniref:DUF2510 domain-containing protein n=1 Tax=Microbacterium dextranolyticum TaxID=36806 RepID=A0A9W6M6K9_9MICO|nr:DUF2510 domain-containing protein [Microbacterium dextranolyticum]MBM7462907.1 hypothetical protein [Microbacterium dextranolyticum]GLJ95987.1 hypothetical protein GCM10017591_20500 [Microbacterium dextranolyticum]
MASPGWYPHPQNPSQELYWDGTTWTAARARKSKNGGVWLALGITAAALIVTVALGIGAVAVVGAMSAPRVAGSATQSPGEPQAQKPIEKTPTQKLEADGYQEVKRGIFAKWEPKSSYTCDYWSCSKLRVISVDGCPNSLYIEAAIISGSTQVGMTNDLTTALRPMEEALVTLTDHTSNGDSFRLTEATCY